MKQGYQAPGILTLGQIEVLVKKMETECGAAAGDGQVSPASYFKTLRDLYLSVPSVPNQNEMTEEEKDAMLERHLGCTKAVFLSRIRTMLRKRAQRVAAEKANKDRLRRGK